jgi:acetyl esterase/lipase
VRSASAIIAIAAALILAAWWAIEVSPWPSALAIRYVLDSGAWRANAALAGRVPAGVTARRNEIYDAADPDARLDVFYPSAAQAEDKALLTVVWIHGGGFLSGSKDQIANYAQILAAGGYTVVAVDYSLAPERKYPTPLRQLNIALAYLQKNAARLHIDPQRFVLAGDSAGALLAAQVANLVTSVDYARALELAPTLKPSQIAGLVLYCGPYDMRRPATAEPLGWFLRTLLWSYGGRRDFANAPRVATLAVVNYLTPQFPPSFISVGNADPLSQQSRGLALALTRLGVRVDSLFFADDYTPRLAHEYQFNLDTDAARLALERAQEFLTSLH